MTDTCLRQLPVGQSCLATSLRARVSEGKGPPHPCVPYCFQETLSPGGSFLSCPPLSWVWGGPTQCHQPPQVNIKGQEVPDISVRRGGVLISRSSHKAVSEMVVRPPPGQAVNPTATVSRGVRQKPAAAALHPTEHACPQHGEWKTWPCFLIRLEESPFKTTASRQGALPHTGGMANTRGPGAPSLGHTLCVMLPHL